MKIKFPIILSLLLFFSVVMCQAQMVVDVLNVGYGSAVHVEDDLSQFLFDVGPESASQTLINFLSEHGVTRIDAIFITHAQKDHVGALLALMDQFKVDHLFWNDNLPPDENIVSMLDQAEQRTKFQIIKPGMTFPLSPNLTVNVLNSNLKTIDLNDNSLVYGLNYGSTRLLIPGDIGKVRQQDLVKQNKKWLLNVKWVLWPHHGDELASSFISVFKRPVIGVISVGKNNYGLPKIGLESQAREFCSQLYRTDQHGPLRFIVSDGIQLVTQAPPDEDHP